MKTSQLASENLRKIGIELEEITKAINNLKMGASESLQDFEYRVKMHSDKLLSLKIAEQVQQRLLEQEAQEAQEQVKKTELGTRREI